jgi:hypothetical protein
LTINTCCHDEYDEGGFDFPKCLCCSRNTHGSLKMLEAT